MSDANLVLFSLLGGTALLLYGVRFVGDGLQRAAGTRLRHILSTLTGNRLKSLLVGAGVTAVLQSSSATTVMLVGFASAGLLTLRQTIGVILGADIGTTVTVQLLAFDLLQLSPLIVFVGWVLYVTGRGTAPTAVIAAIGQNAEARRVAAAHAAFKIVGVAIFFPFIGPFADLVRATSPDVQRQIANAHTIFNVALALVFLPFSGVAADFVTRLIPEVRRTGTGPMYLNPAVLDTPAVAPGALASGDREVAEKVIRHKSVVNTMERQLRAAHIQRLHEGLRESIDTSSIHLDLLASFKRANSLVTGIAYAVLGQHDA